jgi:hypothetical protein
MIFPAKRFEHTTVQKVEKTLAVLRHQAVKALARIRSRLNAMIIESQRRDKILQLGRMAHVV